MWLLSGVQKSLKQIDWWAAGRVTTCEILCKTSNYAAVLEGGADKQQKTLPKKEKKNREQARSGICCYSAGKIKPRWMTWKADQGSAWWEPHLVKSWAHQDHSDPFCAQPQQRGEGVRNRLSIESARAAFPSPTPNVLQTLALWGCRPPCLQLMLVSPKLCYWGELWFGFYQPGWDPRGSVRHVLEPRPWSPSHPHPSHFTASALIRPTARRATEGG